MQETWETGHLDGIYVFSSPDEIYRAWGTPEREEDQSDGSRALYWSDRAAFVYPRPNQDRTFILHGDCGVPIGRGVALGAGVRELESAYPKVQGPFTKKEDLEYKLEIELPRADYDPAVKRCDARFRFKIGSSRLTQFMLYAKAIKL